MVKGNGKGGMEVIFLAFVVILFVCYFSLSVVNFLKLNF